MKKLRDPMPVPCGSSASTVEQLLTYAASLLRDAGVDTPLLDAELLLAEALGTTRTVLLTHPELEAEPERARRFGDMVSLRARRMPLAYIVGHKEFYGLELSVSPAALIPRPETEVLVETALAALRSAGRPRIAEIGVGSGAVAIVLAKSLPTLRVWGTDCSDAALDLARLNAEMHAVGDRVVLLLGDLLEPLAGMTFDAIISNPPYIPSKHIRELQPEIGYEPSHALDGGPDGLDCYRRIATSARAMLRASGRLFLEVGQGQAAPVAGILREAGWEVIPPIRDYSGIERVMIGKVG